MNADIHADFRGKIIVQYSQNMFKKIITHLNIIKQCKRYGLSPWQCPQFLFLIMGIFIAAASLIFYLIGIRYIEDPGIIAFFVLTTAVVLFIIAFTITQSFERLAEASRMKSEFIDIVSHQMRSPLTNLKWSFELLTSEKEEMEPVRQEEYFSSIKDNIERMVELVDDLLIVSKIEQGTFPMRKKEVDLEDIIKELIHRYQSFSEASNIKIVFYPQGNFPKVFSDPSMLKLVIENFIDNAVRYTKGGGEVKIGLKQKNKELFFQISDSGIGIPKEDQKYIFQKFFRAKNVSKEQTRGSGLGLYITKTIIKKLGGRVWFESEEGRGTTFYFTLPIK
ncbi:MAG: HAMP domain-containing histidine kinase [Candidatus Nealsonbacteria bacterium]|nr:HAMP domain-containing histidine kinase [Candidatus Nealsonbacteria bacterium]